MVGSMRILSGKLGGKTCLFAIPTLWLTIWMHWIFFLKHRSKARQHTSSKIKLRVGDNFQAVILQCIRLITGTKNMHALIYVWITSLNCEVIDEFICDSYTTDTGYLGRACRNKNAEQHYCTFLNLVLHGNCVSVTAFFANGGQDESCNPENWHQKKWRDGGNRRVIPSGKKKHEQPPPLPMLYIGGVQQNRFSLLWTLWRIWSNHLCKTFQGV